MPVEPARVPDAACGPAPGRTVYFRPDWPPPGQQAARLRPPAVVSRRSPGVVPQSSSVSRVMLSLPRPVHDQMVAYCLVGLPDEACGLLGGNPGTGEAVTCYPTRNLAASAKLYTVDPKEHLRADRDAEAGGNSIIGVFHSHTHTEAYPSPTDVDQAPDPGWHYVLVSFRDTQPVVRSYRIVDGLITEEPVRLLHR